MVKDYIMAIDQGTTGTRVILVDQEGNIVSSAYREITQIYPHPGWVEHNPREYWETTLACMREAMKKAKARPSQIAGIGITNQRETTVMWDRETGQPVYNAIVWQCRRTAPICEDLKARGFEEKVREKTGLTIDAYFSATKIKWILENVPEAMDLAKKGRLLMGCVDSWLVWNLSGGVAHVTDYSNASRTMLFNVRTLEWDQELLDALGIPREILPSPKPSSGVIALARNKEVLENEEIPISGVAGDQQAALFGQTCFKPGMAKNTYGTALALMMNIGEKFLLSRNGLTTDLAWGIEGRVEYSLEGLAFVGGAAVQWLRDGLKIIENAAQTESMAQSVPDTAGVYVVPAFTGLCAPYWDMYARGLIIGITRGTTREHIVRATLESMAYQTRDILEAMMADSGQMLESLRVDGGAVKNNFLMQFQADILGVPVIRPVVTEMTAMGAAYLAGLGVGFWRSKDEIAKQWKVDRIFEPKMDASRRKELYAGWKRAVERAQRWAQ
ncbi:MAG: glycerol kinase GlpK [Candidatus Caldatribacterium sp.]|nr:glycerol kinase GlpK [Candidatus Caldatribacterium sp.]